jgi:hypothetical protein
MLVMDCDSEDPDVIVEWGVTGTLSLYGHTHGRGMGYTSTNPAIYELGKTSAYGNLGDDIIFGLASGNESIRLTCLIKGGASGGRLTLKWSQRNTDGSNPARMLSGSYIKQTMVEEITS